MRDFPGGVQGFAPENFSRPEYQGTEFRAAKCFCLTIVNATRDVALMLFGHPQTPKAHSFPKVREKWGDPLLSALLFLGLSPVICAAQQIATDLDGRRVNPLLSKVCGLVVLVFVRELCPVLQARGHTAEAVFEYPAGLRIRPLDATANRPGGAVLTASGHPDRALSYLQMAARTSPECLDAPYNLGNASASRGDFPGAREQFRRSRSHQARRCRRTSNLGSTLAEPGRFPEAKAQFERALEINPAHVLAGENREQLQSVLRNH
jgi:tetratricopeptide (TPR) repeat protein